LNTPFDRAQVLSLAFSADGSYLAGSLCGEVIENDGTCPSWDGPSVSVVPLEGSGSTAYYLPAPTNEILFPLAFAPGGYTLATGGPFQTLVWDIASQTYSGDGLVGHDSVSSLRYSPFGSLLAAGYKDARLTLWDVATSTRIGPPLSGSSAIISSLAFTPRGDKVYAGLEDGTVQVWDLDPEIWIERACQVAGRSMFDFEWERFFPNQSPRETCPPPSG
jgi:WD40 repeat protein